MSKTMRVTFTIAVLAILCASACGKKQTPVPAPTQPPPAASNTPATGGGATTAPRRVEDLPVPAQPVSDDSVSNANLPLDELNKNSPLKPVFFAVDSSDLDDTARTVASENAEVLKKNAKWVITIEGHCDERGTAEYNLALGERRAITVKTYLVSLGISPDRIRTISYDKEFPFDPGRTEEAMARNRRGHFVITSN